MKRPTAEEFVLGVWVGVGGLTLLWVSCKAAWGALRRYLEAENERLTIVCCGDAACCLIGHKDCVHL